MNLKGRTFLISILMCVGCCIGGYKVWHHIYFRYLITDLQPQLAHFPLCRNADLAYLPESKLDSLLSHPFTYIGQGAQTQTFGSSDGCYVLKISHFKCLNPPWMPLSPLWWSWNKAVEDKKKAKYQRWYTIHYNVIANMPSLSGTKWLHFASGVGPSKIVSVIDRLGARHQLDLRDLHWVLQERVVPADEVILSLLHQGNEEQALNNLYKFFDLVIAEAQVGWIDEDTGYIHNCGFTHEGELIHYDIGRLTPLHGSNGEILEWQLAQLHNRLSGWINKRGGERATQLKASLESYYLRACATRE